MSENDFIKICHSLTLLAILKNHKAEEKQIALMAKFLLSELSCEDIMQACTYLSKRVERFPDVASFFNLVAPMESVETLAEKEISQMLEYVRNGRDNFKNSGAQLSDLQKDLMSVWSWSELASMNEKDLGKTRLNMTFYLRSKINSDGKLKLLSSKKAFINYQQELKQLEEKNADSTNQ
jgi:hypothetical protein